MLLNAANKHFLGKGQLYLALLYQAILLTAYFGMLRISEVTKGTHPILARDVQIGVNKKFLFILRTSKTHGLEAPPRLVKISKTKSNNKHRLTIKKGHSNSGLNMSIPGPKALFKSKEWLFI